jgi:hypothetical protein
VTDERRLIPLSGAAFVLLVVLALIVGGKTPSSGASVEEVARFYDDGLSRQFASTFVLAAAAPFIVLFGVALGGASSSASARVLRAGAILVAATVLVSAALHLAVVDGADQGISPTALQALNALDGNTWLAMTSGLGVLMLGAAGHLVSTGARWLGWPALVLAVALFVPFASVIAMLVTAIWIVLAGITTARGRSAKPATPIKAARRASDTLAPARPQVPD